MSRGRSGDEEDAPARIPAVSKDLSVGMDPGALRWFSLSLSEGRIVRVGPFAAGRTRGPERKRGGIGGGGIAGPQQGTQLNLLKQTVKTQSKRSPLTS